MPDKSGFIDLRIGHGAQGISDDSVWPSFTDIMTVIVMIFLMALVIMMVRNYELDRQLVNTRSAEEASFLENQGLVDKLDSLESKMLGLQKLLGTSDSERITLRTQLVQELKRIELMVADNITLEDQLAEILAQRNQLAREKQALAEQGQLTSESLATAESDKQALAQAVLELQQQNRTASEEFDAVQSEKKSLVERVQALFDRSSTLDQQRKQAEQRILDLTANEAKLGQKIAALVDQFDALKIQSSSEIGTLSETNLTLTERLNNVSSQLVRVEALLQREQLQRRQLGAQVEAQSQEILDKQSLLERLTAIQQQSAKRYTDANSEIDRLTELISQRQAENADLQKLAEASGTKFRSLQDEYESLDAKFRKLVRPARSSAGKYVVSVRVAKSGDSFQFQLREPSQQTPVSYSREVLEQRLEELKSRHGKNLYTKVVIPENSQLSYNEAWRFTQEILRGFDYYYQQYPDAANGSIGEQ